MKTSETMLREARELEHAIDKVDQANELFREVVARADGTSWGEANLELSSYYFGQGDYQRAEELGSAVLEGPEDLANDASRARAGVMVSSARDMLELEVDDALLSRNAERCIEHGEPYWGAVGLALLGRHLEQAGDLDGARAMFERSAALYDETGSVTGSPTMLSRLAEIAAKQGRPSEAGRYLDRAIAHLRKFPFGGLGPRNLERKLIVLRERLARP
jgi:tetratricopeptide (TPR) repeat protein